MVATATGTTVKVEPGMVVVDGPTRTVHWPLPGMEVPEPNQVAHVPAFDAVCGAPIGTPAGVGAIEVTIDVDKSGTIGPLVWCPRCFPHGRPNL